MGERRANWFVKQYYDWVYRDIYKVCSCGLATYDPGNYIDRKVLRCHTLHRGGEVFVFKVKHTRKNYISPPIYCDINNITREELSNAYAQIKWNLPKRLCRKHL